MAGMPQPPKISPELGEFMESGLAIVVGTRGEDLEPEGASALALRVEPDRTRLTVFLYEEAARALLKNLATWPEIAVQADLPTSHRACQAKGRFLGSRHATEEERPLVARQLEGFVMDLGKIGVPRRLTEGWNMWPCVALTMEVHELYEQTPGPGAGEPLR